MTQYFWPEQFRVNDLVTALTGLGHRVDVLTGYPNYPTGSLFPGYRMRGILREHFGAVRVIRLPLWTRHDGSARHLIANYLSLAAMATAMGSFLLPQDIDVVFVYEPSPLTIAVPGLAVGRALDVPVVLWVQDLWPDTLFAMKIGAKGPVRRLASRASAALHTRMDQVLIQSRAMHGPLVDQGVRPDRIHYVPNWAPETALPSPPAEPPPESGGLPEGFVVMFAGNIGEAQSLDTVLDAAELVRDVPDIHWVILGDGRRMGWLLEEVATRSLGRTVHVLGHHPPHTMPSWFALADVLLLTLRAEPVYELTIPSKLQAYLASGKPVLAAVDGEGARIVRESGAGLTAPAGDAPALARAVRTLYALDPERLATMGAAGLSYSDANFRREVLISEIETLLQEAVGPLEPPSARSGRPSLVSPGAPQSAEFNRALGKCLVTGATGFVGQALVEELEARQVPVLAAVRSVPAPDEGRMELRLPGPVDEDRLAGVNTVFHLAGIAHAISGGPPPQRYDEVNRLGTVQLARAAAAAGVLRFVFVSSVKAVGEPGPDIVPEASRAYPNDPYGMSKRQAEDELLEVASDTGMEVVIARPTLVYGPGVKGNLAALATSIERGSPPPLPAIHNRRSLIGLRDLVRALILLGEDTRAPGGIFVLSDGEVYSTDRLIRALAAAADVRPTPRLRLPRGVLVAGAHIGDAIQRISRWSPPLTTDRFDRLVGNAEYESSAIRSLGFQATETFEDCAKEIICLLREVGSPARTAKTRPP